MTQVQLNEAAEKFKSLLKAQAERNEKIKETKDFIDYKTLDKIVIGICMGDGIGPVITRQSAKILEYILSDDIKKGRIEFKYIDGLTIENRIAVMKPIPDDVMQELKSCNVILKGPTTTPQAGRRSSLTLKALMWL
ncbi:MAG: isocitrate/isopropylmalate family dehydrogenase [Acutalibacteraceae bacterium]